VQTEQVNVHYAKTHLSRLLVRVEAGAQVTIARAGHPVATLSAAVTKAGKDRRLGTMRGKIRIGPDFDDPLPADLAAAFEGRG